MKDPVYILRVFFTFLNNVSLDMMVIMCCVSVNTPKSERMKRARSVTSETVDNEDTRSVSSAASGTRTPSRKTPSQVKAENAARKSKVI